MGGNPIFVVIPAKAGIQGKRLPPDPRFPQK
jgi:hypothetical protein